MMNTSVMSPGIKRSHDGTPIQSGLSVNSPKMQATPGGPRSQRAASPALSVASSTLSDLTSLSTTSPQPANSAGSAPKKPKLTFAEKEVEKAVKKAEKEKRAREKTELKEKKEAEKLEKDEERKRKAEEKEVEKLKKDMEKAKKDQAKREKDEEKKRKADALEAEKLKKERAQMRIRNFFGRPAPVSTPPSTPDDVSTGVSSRRSSIASIDMAAPILDTKVISTHPDYYKWILPFFPHDHTTVAPSNRFLASGSSTPVCVDLPEQYPNAIPQPLNQRFNQRKRRVTNIVPVKTLVGLIGGSEDTPIDLTDEPVLDEASLLLSKTRFKILSFQEDVRPPYRGTYTRPVSPRSSKKLSRDPTSRTLQDTNYDYDSEAEWQAPEEGDEDLEDDDDVSEDEADAEEMDDFLDDENDTSKRKPMTVDVAPVSTGLFWEGETDLGGLGIDIAAFRLDVLHDDQRLPIDPYSNVHWSLTGTTTPMKAKPIAADTAMQPPRLPLANLTVPNGSPLRGFVTTGNGLGGPVEKENATPQLSKLKAKKTDKAIKLVSDDIMPAFKSAISGSDLNKVALVEILKKQFPSCSKDTIKGTLEMVAIRQGKKEVDKRWVLIA